MNALLTRLLIALTSLSALGWLAYGVSAWYLCRVRARRFAHEVDLLRPVAAAREHDWFAACLEELHNAVERDLAESTGVRVPGEFGRQQDRLAAEAAKARPGPARTDIREDRGDLPQRGHRLGPGAHQHADLQRVPDDGAGHGRRHANPDAHGSAPHEELDTRAGAVAPGAALRGTEPEDRPYSHHSDL